MKMMKLSLNRPPLPPNRNSLFLILQKRYLAYSLKKIANDLKNTFFLNPSASFVKQIDERLSRNGESPLTEDEKKTIDYIQRFLGQSFSTDGAEISRIEMKQEAKVERSAEIRFRAPN